jgi:RNA polymerase sigma-70 factor (ECF subfamily)
MRRKVHREVPLGAALANHLPATAKDPQSERLQALCAEKLEPFVAEAFAALSPRERSLLRQHYLDGLLIGALAEHYRVHRVTVARWLEGARQTVIKHLRATLERELELSKSDISSLLELVYSRIDLSVTRLLAER